MHGLASPDLERELTSGRRSALFIHGYYGTCVSGRKLHLSPTAEVCTRKFSGACLGLYHARRCGGLNPVTMLKLFQVQSRRHSMLSSYGAVIVSSDRMNTEFIRNGVPPERIHRVTMPIPGVIPDATPPAARRWSGKLLFLGRLTEVKGVGLLAPAIAMAEGRLGRRLSVTVAGEGPAGPALEAAAKRRGAAWSFPGWVDGDAKAALMREADALIVPSIWPEPFGLVGIEAAAVGLPSVAFDVGGIGEWLLPGVTGELAGHPPTAEGLASAIVRLLSDHDRWQGIRVGAWQRAQGQTIDAHVGGLLPAFQEVLQA